MYDMADQIVQEDLAAENHRRWQLSRRRLLKLMGAAGIAAVAINVPSTASVANGVAVTNGEVNGAADSAVARQAQPQLVNLVEYEFGFDMDRIKVQAGVPVELSVTNEGDQVHGIWIPDLAIMDDIRSGKSKVFKFTPEKPGRFRFTCSYNLCGTEEEHAQMKGFIEVI